MSSSGKHTCPVCSRCFETAKGMLLHVSKSHSNVSINATCEYCQKSYKSLTKLYTHYNQCESKQKDLLNRAEKLLALQKENIKLREQCNEWKDKYLALKEEMLATVPIPIQNYTYNNFIDITVPTTKPITDKFIRNCLQDIINSGCVITSALDLSAKTGFKEQV